MNSIIIPASKNKMILIKLGDAFHRISSEYMEQIRKWINANNDWLDRRKELSTIFGIKTRVVVFPPLNSNKEHVWMIERSEWAPEDVQSWKDIFKEVDSADHLLFIDGNLSIKRLSKSLIPFL